MKFIKDKKALLLDMNSTFMFGEDRFSDDEDYSKIYRQLGGELPNVKVNRLVRSAYQFLDERYPQPKFNNQFPSLETAFQKVSEEPITNKEMRYLIATFAHHERGKVSAEYVETLRRLAKIFRLALVIDIWSPKGIWLEYFKSLDILNLFETISFSSESGHVKPSPFSFKYVLNELKLESHQAIVIGDSKRRDLGGALAAGLDCILVGGATSSRALASYQDLIKLCQAWKC